MNFDYDNNRRVRELEEINKSLTVQLQWNSDELKRVNDLLKKIGNMAWQIELVQPERPQ